MFERDPPDSMVQDWSNLAACRSMFDLAHIDHAPEKQALADSAAGQRSTHWRAAGNYQRRRVGVSKEDGSNGSGKDVIWALQKYCYIMMKEYL